MNKAFFIDRDGVIVVEKNYLSRPEEVELIPGAAEALKKIKAAGYLTVVVSNQSGVARGYYSEGAVAEVNRRIAELLAVENAEVDAFYHCPHHPDFSGGCECRKPAPGMLRRAARELDIELGSSFMIGDKISDIEAGNNAGCRECVLIKTGHGTEEIGSGGAENVMIAEDFQHAAGLLLNLI